MFNNCDITIYNKYYDKDSDTTKYARTYLSDVDWQSKQAIKLMKDGLFSNDIIKIFIPHDVIAEGKSYIKPKAYSRLSDKSKHFTFNMDDKIVKGIIDFEITGISPNNIGTLENYYDDVINVISIIDCGLTENWEIGGK